MARLTDRQSTQASERLRLIVSRSRGGYNVTRAKFARVLGVQERSVERYLQKRAAAGERRRIRDPEMKRKIDRAFRYRAKDPLFLADIILTQGQMFDVTEWMIRVLGDPENDTIPLMVLWRAGYGNAAPNSVWNERKTLPRIVFTGGDRMGMAYGGTLLTARDATGAIYEEGTFRRITVDNEYFSSTFGFVQNKVLGLKGRPDDLAYGINHSIERFIQAFEDSKKPAVIPVLMVFDPELGAVLHGYVPPPSTRPREYTVGFDVRNRSPIVKRTPVEGKNDMVNFIWAERKRGRKR